MLLHLHDLTICLDSCDQRINDQWQQLLDGWLEEVERPFSIHFSLRLSQTLPPLPTSPPLFSDHHHWPNGVGVLTVYATDSVYLLHFQDGAFVQVNLTQQTIHGVVLPAALEYGRFQDITFTALAPLLRRQGYYLVHGFAASQNGRSLLLVGPSGSGKTTAGLSLVLAGWELLANDMVLLQKRGSQVEALPMPDRITVRPTSIQLLPQLQTLVSRPSHPHLVISQELPKVIHLQKPDKALSDLSARPKWVLSGAKPYAPAAPVSAVFFPQVTKQAETAVQPIHRALALVCLIEESIDQWDTPTLPAHLELLQTLCQQTTTCHLHLGQDISHLAATINNWLPANSS